MKDLINTILFGKYEILSQLGTGSFGTVYLSKHQILETYCAIKLIPKLEKPTVSLLSEAKLLTRQEFRWLMEGLSIEQPKAIKQDNKPKDF